jgi:hypothetical protein
MKFWSRAVMAAAVALALAAEAGYAAPTVALTAPSRPSSPKATPGDTRVTLTWVQPTSPIDHYVPEARGICHHDDHQLRRHQLTNGKLYVHGEATNADGDGPSSVAVTATPRAVPPDRPRDVAATLVQPMDRRRSPGRHPPAPARCRRDPP